MSFIEIASIYVYYCCGCSYFDLTSYKLYNLTARTPKTRQKTIYIDLPLYTASIYLEFHNNTYPSQVIMP